MAAKSPPAVVQGEFHVAVASLQLVVKARTSTVWPVVWPLSTLILKVAELSVAPVGMFDARSNCSKLRLRLSALLSMRVCSSP